MTFSLDGDIDPAAKNFRYRDESVTDDEGFRVKQAAGDGDLKTWDDGWWPIWIHCQRGEPWENRVFKSGCNLGRLHHGEVARLEWIDAGLFQCRDDRAGKQAVLLRAHFENPLAEGCQISAGGEA